VYALNIGYYAGAILTGYILPYFGIESIWHGEKVIAVLFIVALTVINLSGASGSNKFGMYLVLALLLVLGLYVILGVVSIFTDFGASKKNFEDLMPQGPWGFIQAMGFFALAFQGSEVLAQAVKELKNPKKDLKRALFFSYGIIVAVYLLVVFAALAGTHGLVPSWKILAEAGEGAFVKSASFFPLGSIVVILVLGAGFAASLAALNSTIFSSSHAATALARAKSVPEEIGILSSRGVPHIAAILSSLGMIFMIVALPLMDVAAVANLLFVVLFLGVNWALITLRNERSEISRPYKVPFFPWLNLLAIIGYIIVAIPLLSVSSKGVVVVLSWFFLGMFVWWLFAKKNLEEETASSIIYEVFLPLGSETYAKVLCPVVKDTDWKPMARIAHSIAKSRNTGVCLCLLQDLPKGVTSWKDFERLEKEALTQNDLSGQASLRAQKTEMLARAMEFYEQARQEMESMPSLVSLHFISAALTDVPPSREQIERYGHAQMILRMVEKMDADILFVPFEHIEYLKRGFVWPTLTRVLRRTHCHLMVIKVRQSSRLLREELNCLVPYVINSHSRLLLDMLMALRSYLGKEVRFQLLHAQEPGKHDKTLAKIPAEFERLGIGEGKVEIETDVSDIPALIAAKGKGHDLLLLAAPREHSFHEIQFGKIIEKVLEISEVTTIIVHRHQGIIGPLIAPLLFLYRTCTRYIVPSSSLS